MRHLFGAILVSSILIGCGGPNAETISKFSSGLDDTSVAMNGAFADANRSAIEEIELGRATEFALAEHLDQSGGVIVRSDQPVAPITDEMLAPRRNAISSLQAYARLLVALGNGNLGETFSQEIDGLGSDLSALQVNAEAVLPGASEADFGLFTQALNGFGSLLIESKAEKAISEVAPRVHPILVEIVDSLQKDLDLLVGIVEENSLQSNDTIRMFLESIPVSRANQFERLQAYRGLYLDFDTADDRIVAIGNTKRALSQLISAHSSIVEESSPSAEAAIGRFAKIAETASLFYEK